MHLPLGTLIALACGGLLIGLGFGSLPAYSFRKRVRFMEHLIEIRNNPLGWETVLLDGQVVHSKFAFGGTYKFMIGQDQAEVRIRYRWHLLGVRVRFFVNDQVCYEE